MKEKRARDEEEEEEGARCRTVYSGDLSLGEYVTWAEEREVMEGLRIDGR